MDEKTLSVLEFPKVLERLAGYASFSASAELATSLRPADSLEESRHRLQLTSEGRKLLSVNADVSVGGTTDIRPMVEVAVRQGVLNPAELLAVKVTMQVGRELERALEKNRIEYPLLNELSVNFHPPSGLIEAITRCISEQAEVMDSASVKLGALRREVRLAHEKLMSKLERMVNDPRNAPLLQEPIITQRNGRYVIPLRTDFKGRIKSIVHDQSSSGSTLFVEPLATVELNNAWQEAILAEQNEVRRILAELSAKVGEEHDLLIGMLDALAEFDLVLACARYADDLHASEPILVPFNKPGEAHHPGSTIRLTKARHPLLSAEHVVPITVDLDDQTFCVVLTGPNTGGKTVSLKTVGLLALMAQSGLHIPAQSGSQISYFKQIFADIGDEQSIEQSLSTFSGHITNIIHILNMAGRYSLVLLDELGAGTDPQEGSALARAILTHLVGNGITSLVATHYPELKAYAHSTPGVTNASLEFDLKTLRPTYHLTIGLPGRSNALAIASRLGLPNEIIENAKQLLDPNDLKADDLLGEIHHQRDAARKARERVEKTKLDTERLHIEYARRLDKVEEERRSILEQAQQESLEELATLKEEVEMLRKELIRARQPLEKVKSIQEKVKKLEERKEKPIDKQPPVLQEPEAIRVGSRVILRTLKTEGVITSLTEKDAEVQVGNLRLRADLADLRLKGSTNEKDEPSLTHFTSAKGKKGTPFYPSPGVELDVRGKRADEALDAVERYMESAYLAGMPYVRIIHGKATGKLRQEVRRALKGAPHVSKIESGRDNEGGDGVTVVHLHQDD
jgi:DNA mismatch repair protein MutS2